MDDNDNEFLNIEGMLHEISVGPVGNPWPFCLMVCNGSGETVSALVHEDDAQQIIDFFSLHMPKEV